MLRSQSDSLRLHKIGPKKPTFFRITEKARWTRGVKNVTVCCQASAGRDSQAIADWLVDAACHWVSSNKDLAISEVVDFFESILYQEMHLLIEDGSTEEVANLILDFYVKCSTLNEEDVIAAVRTLPKCDLSKCQVSLIISL